MTKPSPKRLLATTLGLVSVLAALTAGGAHAAERELARNDPGINSAQALANPQCDADRQRIKNYYYAAAPCVKPWADGTDNGGATAQGVTADTIKVVVLVNEPLPSTVSAGFVVNQATGSNGSPTNSTLDFNEVYKHVFETWGRDLEFTFVQSTGPDETAQRADAVKVAALKPFAVLDWAQREAGTGGGRIFTSTLDETVPFVTPAPSDPALVYVPYQLNAAEFVGKSLANRKAKWAGQAELKSQARKFAVVYETNGANPFDPSVFRKTLAKYGGTVSEELPIDIAVDVSEATSKAQAQAPQVAAKLKAAGINNVVLFLDPRASMPALLTQMTAQEYFPEITITTFGFSDLSFYGRIMDPEQMKHAFGLGWFTPWVDGFAAADKSNFQWYWGADQGTYSSGSFSLLLGLYNGIHLAGPNLTKKSFDAALQKMPPTGGHWSDHVTTLESRPTQPGKPAMRGSALVWWNPDIEGPTQQVGAVGEGVYMYLDGGKRYVAGKFPKGEPKFFDEKASLYQFDAVPPDEVIRAYPCDGCPSSGGGPSPASEV